MKKSRNKKSKKKSINGKKKIPIYLKKIAYGPSTLIGQKPYGPVAIKAVKDRKRIKTVSKKKMLFNIINANKTNKKKISKCQEEF
tara:strand:- start:111 stop:365 length:255 start_codon:yes stop_codon:yes gene_type:complete